MAHIAYVVCTHGPWERRFEERFPETSVALMLSGTFVYRSGGGAARIARVLAVTISCESSGTS